MTAQKPAERRAGAQPAPRNLVHLPVKERPIPAVPDGLSDWTAELWNAYWVSDVAKVAADVDLGAVEVYFTTLDEWRKCTATGRRKRFVEGSTGQPRLNPLLERADRLASLIPKLAAEIGLSPKARAALAINVGQAAKTIEDLNREVDAPDDADDYAGITTLVEPGPAVADEG